MTAHNTYQSPLTSRYASPEMSRIFSDDFKFTTWRHLWLYLARAEQLLGIDISNEQLDQMENALTPIDYELAARKEGELRHDVMAHVHTFAAAAPLAAPIIHLGATSCYVGDNTELIQIKAALTIIRKRLYQVIQHLTDFCLTYKDLPTLGFTHFQPAQLTTVGKRAAMWLQDMVFAFEEVERRLAWLPFRGVKGTTGTQASFLALLGSAEKVEKLDQHITEQAGFPRRLSICGQTYTRQIDTAIVQLLSLIGASAAKMSEDIRLLQGLKEIEEPFGSKQVGSSAMAYKRNPMRSERISGLARFLSGLSVNPLQTQATQWLERTLDDSANRRLVLSEGFLTCDAILLLMDNIASGLVVNDGVIAKRVKEELPFMATENILMACVQHGADRQKTHEVIRSRSLEAAAEVKQHGRPNDLLHRLKTDDRIPLSDNAIDQLIDAKRFIGLAPLQTERYIRDTVRPLLEKFDYLADSSGTSEPSV